MLREPRARVISEFAFEAGRYAPGGGGGGAAPWNASTVAECVEGDAPDCRAWLARACRHQLDVVCGRDAPACLGERGEAARRRWLAARYGALATVEAGPRAHDARARAWPALFHGARARCTRAPRRTRSTSARPPAAAEARERPPETLEGLGAAARAWLAGACAAETALHEAVVAMESERDPAARRRRLRGRAALRRGNNAAGIVARCPSRFVSDPC